MKIAAGVLARTAAAVGLAAVGLACATGEVRGLQSAFPKAEGYLGIWYYNQKSNDAYRYKYSGGFATYPQQHLPIAVYAPRVNKTFFVYGGTTPGKQELLNMVSYYDHASGTVPRPTILVNKKTEDAHDNATMTLGEDGALWIFCNAHGTSRPAYIYRSKQPYTIDDFERVTTTNFSYGQPWQMPGQGFLFLHTRYADGRNLFWMTSPDGREWGEPRRLSRFGQGHYQISWRDGTRLATVFDYHPPPLGLNARTNLYYLETRDQGKSWTTVDGKIPQLPLADPQNDALIRDYQAEKMLVYLKDLQFDAQGRPVILYLTTKGYESGPANGPRAWHTARWTGDRWEIRPFTTSDHNYDHGSLYIEPDGQWRVIAPTDPGPQPWCTGGEMVVWTSRDLGANWVRGKTLTPGSKRNHTYARKPVDARDDFYALWADGDALEPSESALYFTNRAGDHVWRLPGRMTGSTARPEVAW